MTGGYDEASVEHGGDPPGPLSPAGRDGDDGLSVAEWTARLQAQYPDATLANPPSAPGGWTARRLGALRLTRISGGALQVDHPAARGADAHEVALLLNLGPPSLVAHAGAEPVLGPGGAILVDPRLPSSIRGTEALLQCVVELPRAWFTQAEIHHARGRALDDNAWLARWARLAWVAATQAPQAGADAPLGLRAALRASGALSPAASTHDDSRYRRALALIALEEPDDRLDASALAARVGLSRRRLDALFARCGTTVERTLWESRLLRAAEMLREHDAARHGILEVALAHGFATQSHFGRAFVARFGCTPAKWRAAAPALPAHGAIERRP